MCECNFMADGQFTPIKIKEPNMRFIYRDKEGKDLLLIEKFKMDITISKAEVCEIKDDIGKIIGYQFNLR